MTDLFRSGTTIPKGYAVSITSWENDGDDYDTCHWTGLESKNEVDPTSLRGTLVYSHG
jgi:hypothetical protein